MTPEYIPKHCVTLTGIPRLKMTTSLAQEVEEVVEVEENTENRLGPAKRRQKTREHQSLEKVQESRGHVPPRRPR